MNYRQVSSIAKILAVPKMELGKWPTNIDRIEHPEIGPILVKRDDQCGFGKRGYSGVKTRKLETFLQYLVDAKIGEVSILLSNITNLGFDLATQCRKHGIALNLLIINEPPLAWEVRQKLFSQFTGNVRLIGRSYLVATVKLIWQGLRALARGKRCFIVFPSPSHPAAIIGAAKGYLEAMFQLIENDRELSSSVYIATGAGSTVAGFVLAEALMRAAGAPPVKIVAVRVARQAIWFYVPLLVIWTARFWKLGKLPRFNLEVYSDPDHINYGRFDAALEATCCKLRENYGMHIDPIYGAKSWEALLSREQSNKCRSGRVPLIWHCGFTNDWELLRKGQAPCQDQGK